MLWLCFWYRFRLETCLRTPFFKAYVWIATAERFRGELPACYTTQSTPTKMISMMMMPRKSLLYIVTIFIVLQEFFFFREELFLNAKQQILIPRKNILAVKKNKKMSLSRNHFLGIKNAPVGVEKKCYRNVEKIYSVLLWLKYKNRLEGSENGNYLFSEVELPAFAAGMLSHVFSYSEPGIKVKG